MHKRALLTFCVLLAGAALAQDAGLNLVPQSISGSAVTNSGPHLGTIREALVGIEVVNTAKDGAARQVRRGNGIVLRCDGFVLAPAVLFSRAIFVGGQAENAGQQTVRVFVHPGGADMEVVLAKGPRFVSEESDLAVIKLKDVHFPAVRTLLPDSLAPGKELPIWFAPWNDSTGVFGAPQSTAAALSLQPPGETTRWKILAANAPLERLPVGAVAVGPDGLVVGLYNGSSRAPGFSTMETLNRATNCVSPLTLPDSLRPLGPGAADDDTMVQIPGGPLAVGLTLLKEQPDMEGPGSACVAPFSIDRFEVTNEEYLEFWRSLPEADRRMLSFRSVFYPATWAPWPADPPFPAEIARAPVLGVSLPAAEGFARWKGKRLPTPYEWTLAMLGPRGENAVPPWVSRYIEERKTAWQRLCAAHGEYLRAHPELKQDGIFVHGPFRLPWIVKNPLSREASLWSRQVIHRQLEQLWNMWLDPAYILPAGARPYDASPYGVMDALLNAQEIVVPNPGPPARGAMRYMETTFTLPVPDIRDPWRLFPLEVLTGDRNMQPLSRLYRRIYPGPSLEDVVMWSNLNETLQMLPPLSGWRLKVSSDTVAAATMWPAGRDPYAIIGKPAGFQVWMEMPPRTRREIGRNPPLQGPGDRGGPGPQLHYYLPVGFRCAR